MTTTFSTAALPDVAPLDPTKHVKYTLGMVLGVDDFTQEFAYVAGRLKHVISELIGYGVVCGLRVTTDVDADKGPRVNVAPGEAVTPSGQLVSVAPAQCAFLNDWLRANRADVERTLSPPAPALPLYVVACYRECPTDDVPIPGEPCRSDDELMAPSRVQDDFELELRLTPPEQTEQVALRKFVRWLAQVPVEDAPGSTPEAFLDDLHAALVAAEHSPPTPDATFLDAPPPLSLAIPRDEAGSYFDAALRFWTTEVRPTVAARGPGAECGCGGARDLGADADCVLVAELAVPIVVDAISGDLVVDGAGTVEVDDMSRPSLVSLSLLQEWLFSREGADVGSGTTTAEGVFDVDANPLAARNGLDATRLDKVIYHLTFPGFDELAKHVVSGQPVAAFADTLDKRFEVIPFDDADLVAAYGAQPPGVVVRVQLEDGSPVDGGFSVRIDQLEVTA